LRGSETAAKPPFVSLQRFFCKGNGGILELAVQLESLISIRICSRDPGQHILAKQRLIDVGSDLFASCENLAMMPAKCFLAANIFLLRFWASLLTVFKFFYHLAAFLLQKQTSLTQKGKFGDG
jgi:hypothetical protein